MVGSAWSARVVLVGASAALTGAHGLRNCRELTDTRKRLVRQEAQAVPRPIPREARGRLPRVVPSPSLVVATERDAGRLTELKEALAMGVVAGVGAMCACNPCRCGATCTCAG